MGDGDEISERLPGKVQTNNRAELYAIIRVLESDPTPDKPLTILTDSKYSIQCLQDWFPAWQRNGWRTASKKPVENLDLILLCLMLLRGRKKAPKFVHVRGHEGIEGNENADKLANNGAALEEKAEEVLEIRGKTVEGLKAEWENGDSGVSIQAEETAL
ncbi:RnaseH-domain-containing protein [Atractiella rhizophila]|nr:RnaseH-domain-containing protein [Atractiella rhizophila]